MKYPGQTSIYNYIHYHDDYMCVQFWQSHEKSTRRIGIGPSGCKQYNILYIVWVLGLYGKYKTFPPRYQPSASPRADISGLRSYIRHIDLEPILYILHILYMYHNEAIHQRKMLGYISDTLPCGWCITL